MRVADRIGNGRFSGMGNGRKTNEETVKELKIFLLNDGEDWWIAAYDEADALEVGKTMDIGVGLCENETVYVEEVGMDEELTVGCSDGFFDPDELSTYPRAPHLTEYGHQAVTATVKEWAAVSKHGDCICSSVY